jgi:hypothetical protein
LLDQISLRFVLPPSKCHRENQEQVFPMVGWRKSLTIAQILKG